MTKQEKVEKKIKIKKNKILRHNEYYNTQDTYDELYSKSKNNQTFNNLLPVIISQENILLAYRNIKRNKGSKTAGTNGKTISFLANKSPDQLVNYVRGRLSSYIPESVRREEIPKQSDPTKTRPLGIPTIGDRLIQQCIKQVLEPICEAKFYEHSYGFRSNRSTHHAIAYSYKLMQLSNLHYVVDVDIKGFFDNVDHGKLIKQMWSLGIIDKNLLSIISKILKAPIDKCGIPTKGTPQGGILSPLLSNIVLNELDWWIASQWEYLKMRDDKTSITVNENGRAVVNRSNKYRALRKTKIKEMHIVRYADDFKIFCRSYNDAKCIFIAVKRWLKERLNLDVSQEKSKITNLRKNYTEFLGFKLKVYNDESKDKKDWVVKSHVKDKAKSHIIQTLNESIKEIQKDPNTANTVRNVLNYNSTILGYQRYYGIATRISEDFGTVFFHHGRVMYNRLKKKFKQYKSNRVKKEKLGSTYLNYYKDYNPKLWFIKGIPLYPIQACKKKDPMLFSQETCNFTELGRSKVHDNLSRFFNVYLEYLAKHPIRDKSVEFNDNRISRFIAQKGKDFVTGEYLYPEQVRGHHKIPVQYGGKDSYSNIVVISPETHILIHATKIDTIKKYLLKTNIKSLDMLGKLNGLRVKARVGKISSEIWAEVFGLGTKIA